MKRLAGVSDPEIPVLSVIDMGIIRHISIQNQTITIDLIPTYTGCPAMDTIAMDIKMAFVGSEYDVDINMKLSPAWTTDMISEDGRKKLREYGIAPPMDEASDKAALLEGQKIVPCTLCGSSNTEMISQFGSTPCKALFRCKDCLEPFDYFKCLR